MVVVVGYVASPEGDAALDHAIAEAKASSQMLVVVNASPSDPRTDRRYLHGNDVIPLKDTLVISGVEHEVVQPARGRSAADEIVGAATERGARLVVVGLRRRSRVGKLLLGSTSQQVLLDAPCDVLAVKSGQRTRRA